MSNHNKALQSFRQSYPPTEYVINYSRGYPYEVTNPNSDLNYLLYLNVPDYVVKLLTSNKGGIISNENLLSLPQYVNHDTASYEYKHFKPLWMVTVKTHLDTHYSRENLVDNCIQLVDEYHVHAGNEHIWSFLDPKKQAKSWFLNTALTRVMYAIQNGVGIKDYFEKYQDVLALISTNITGLNAHGSFTSDILYDNVFNTCSISKIEKVCRPGGAYFDYFTLLFSIVFSYNEYRVITAAYKKVGSILDSFDYPQHICKGLRSLAFFVMLDAARREKIFHDNLEYIIPELDTKQELFHYFSVRLLPV